METITPEYAQAPFVDNQLYSERKMWSMSGVYITYCPWPDNAYKRK